jgi:uncharacterized protein YndB with AHSA1/START domain
MSKYKFQTEFEINASKKMLYPYLNSASGLSQWFAEDVTINEDKIFNFQWDGEDHKAKIAAQRTNSFIKFEFLPENGGSAYQEESDEDPSYVELKLDMNDLTQSVFLTVTDYSESDDVEELQDVWESLVHNLKEIVGG